VSAENLQDVQREIGMKKGFDVGLEMSGSPRRSNYMIDNSTMEAHRPAWIMPEKAAVDWNKVVFNISRSAEIYGPRDV